MVVIVMRLSYFLLLVNSLDKIMDRAGSLNHLAMLLSLPLLMPVLPMKHGSLNHFPETPRKTLEVQLHC